MLLRFEYVLSARVGLFPSVSSSHLQKNGLNAKEWIDFCIAEVGLGGKGGGKAVNTISIIYFFCPSYTSYYYSSPPYYYLFLLVNMIVSNHY